MHAYGTMLDEGRKFRRAMRMLVFLTLDEIETANSNSVTLRIEDCGYKRRCSSEASDSGGYSLVHCCGDKVVLKLLLRNLHVELVKPAAHAPRRVFLLLLQPPRSSLEQQLLDLLPALDLSGRAHVAKVASVSLVAPLRMVEPRTGFALRREVAPGAGRGERGGRLRATRKRRGGQTNQVR